MDLDKENTNKHRTLQDKSRLDERIIQTLNDYYKQEIEKQLKLNKEAEIPNFLTRNIIDQALHTRDFLVFSIKMHQEQEQFR